MPAVLFPTTKQEEVAAGPITPPPAGSPAWPLGSAPPKRAHPPALIVLPAEYVPLDPDHERQAINALTELFLQLLAHDADDAES